MDFGFTKEEEKIKKEAHDWFAAELPEDYDPNRSGASEEHRAFIMELMKKASAKGWPTAGWPKKYGGLGFTAIETGLVGEEQLYWGVGYYANIIGYHLVGPTTLVIGTEEQKERIVPPIIKGEVIWFEAFTEPDAGSDEANVQLRAVPDGDEFVLNGQKVFISGAYKPDWLYTLTKTADVVPKNRGLSIFMVPADAPGITFRPLPTMGGSTQNEIFYDDVRVPKENLLGELNRGFYHAMATFEFERASPTLPVRRSMEEWVQYCRKEKRNGKPLLEDPEVREMLAWMAIRQEITWLTGWYGIWRHSQREKLGPQPYNLAGIYRKTWGPSSGKVLMDTFGGLYGQLKPDSKYAKFDGEVQREWESSRSDHAQGTLEIQKMVTATRGLGLPRIPRQFWGMINEALNK